MYLALKVGEEQAPLGANHWRFTRILLAQHFPGWTLDYIDRLSLREVNDVFAVMAAQNKVKDEKND